MGNPKAFLEIHRQEAGYRPIHDRIHDFGEVEQTLNTRERKLQASRCMDCGVPFCHWACPLGNKAPEWNDALYKGDWELAYHLLNSTNPFPEFTGRICPALCEKACVLNRFNHEPTTNREDECAIIEAAFREGYIVPHTNIKRNGKKVAVIGAGPAGLAAANDLNLMGYEVTVFEKNEAAGGLLRYGIPNFKLNKAIIDRRIALLEAEGIEFRYGSAIALEDLGNPGDPRMSYDAYVIATGTPTARDLKAPGRELKGVHFALELLSQQNRVLAGIEFSKDERITAKGKDVLVIGGGDTGSDCIGTAHRQGCKSVTQIEIMPKPVEGPEDPQNPWPNWPRTLKTTSSHEEGCTRRWNINTLEFLGENGHLTGVKVQEIDWKPNPEGGRPGHGIPQARASSVSRQCLRLWRLCQRCLARRACSRQWSSDCPKGRNLPAASVVNSLLHHKIPEILVEIRDFSYLCPQIVCQMTAKEIIQHMESLQNDEQRQILMRFFKTGPGEYGEGDEFLGLKVPQTREVVKAIPRDFPLDQVPELLMNRWHEVRLCGLLVLVSKFEKLATKRLENDQSAIEARDQILSMYLQYAEQANNWDLVDLSVHKILGHWLLLPSNLGDRDYKMSILDELAASPCLWKQRMSMVCSWKTSQMGDPSWCLRYAEIHLHHPHDLMHKAVGWMLREMGKRVSTDLLRDFLRQHAHEMPRTTSIG